MELLICTICFFIGMFFGAYSIYSTFKERVKNGKRPYIDSADGLSWCE